MAMNVANICLLKQLNQMEKVIILLSKRRKFCNKGRIKQIINMRKLQFELNLLAHEIVNLSKTPRKVWSKQRQSDFWDNKVPEGDDNFFKDNFRMSRVTFTLICDDLRSIEKVTTNFRKPISVEKRVAIALYTLGTSSLDYKIIAELFGVARATVCTIVKEFCRAVCEILQPIYLRDFPLCEEHVQECVRGFEEQGFRQCLGAVDSCHIEVRTNSKNYFNHNGWYSTVLLALVDYRSRFLYVDADHMGSCSDAEIITKSQLLEHLQSIQSENSVNINNVNIPIVAVGNSSLPFSQILMKPYSDNTHKSTSEEIFNNTLLKCHKVAKEAFVQIKARFRRFSKALDNNIDTINLMLKASCILHNYLNIHQDNINNEWLDELRAKELVLSRKLQRKSICTENYTDDNAENIRTAIAQYLEEQVLLENIYNSSNNEDAGTS